MFHADGHLHSIGLARRPDQFPKNVLTHLIIEKPHGGRGKASRANIITLARRMQTAIMSVEVDPKNVIEVLPVKWKGTTEKSIFTRRIHDYWMPVGSADRRVFDRAELAPSVAHNAIDAYGIGRKYFAKIGVRETPVFNVIGSTGDR